jgi:hypothetical protein
MRRLALLVIWAVSAGAAGLALTAGSLYAATRPSLRVVREWRQPAGAPAYDDFGPYQFAVVEGDLDWRGFPLDVRLRYFIYMGLDFEQTGYGHMIDYGFHPGTAALDDHLARSSVEWTEAGVTFYEASGHVLFIPRQMFVGGR